MTGQGEHGRHHDDDAHVPLTQQAVPTTLAGGTNLPRTGSNSTLPVVFGGGCLAVGAMLALRKRKTWTRP